MGNGEGIRERKREVGRDRERAQKGHEDLGGTRVIRHKLIKQTLEKRDREKTTNDGIFVRGGGENRERGRAKQNPIKEKDDNKTERR